MMDKRTIFINFFFDVIELAPLLSIITLQEQTQKSTISWTFDTKLFSTIRLTLEIRTTESTARPEIYFQARTNPPFQGKSAIFCPEQCNKT
jgi:hypothetical protein